MKKRLSFILLCLMSLICALLFASCGSGKTPSDDDGVEEPQHEHEYGDWIAEIPATCTESGVRGHFHCSCGKDFDAGKKEIKNLTIEPDWPHEFFDDVCEKCGEELVYTKGLKYTLSGDGEYYILAGIGTSSELDIIVPPVYDNLPVAEIASAAFRRNAEIKSVFVPYTVTKIGAYAFSDCASLESVDFEEGSQLDIIDISAFEYCRKLENFDIPESVTEIGDYAFRTCASLTSAEISENIMNIGFEAFLDCESLSEIKVDENNIYYCDVDGNLYSADGKTLIQYAIGKAALSFEIPSGVTKIGESAFENAAGLMSVNLPASVKTISPRAFDNCKNLESVTLKDGITEIGDYAFEYCVNLSKITIPESVTTIGYRAFDNCVKLKILIIPASVTKIGDYAFSLCTGLTSIDVDEDNPNYKDIDGNLYNKDATELIQYATGKTETHFSIPDSVTDICRWVFSGCKNLESISIPESVTTIGDYAFENCLGLKSISIPDNVTRIGDYSFSSCIALTEVEMPKSVESFGNYAFLGCSSLETLKYGATRADWVNIIKGYEWDADCGDYIITYSYGGIESEIEVDANGYQFIVLDGSYCLLGYEGKATELSLPQNFKGQTYVIGKYAFYQNERITRVTISSGVVAIDEAAFFECTNLKRVYFGKGSQLSSIGASAFAGCSSLSSFGIPGSVTAIGDEAFASCNGLTSFTVPKNVKTIGSKAFYGCVALKTVTFASGSKLTEISPYLFYECGALTEIVIPSGVTEIGAFAFYDCTNLASITIPGTLTSIGESCFYYCTSLESVNFAGTEKEWGAISRGEDWDLYAAKYLVTYNYVAASE